MTSERIQPAGGFSTGIPYASGDGVAQVASSDFARLFAGMLSAPSRPGISAPAEGKSTDVETAIPVMADGETTVIQSSANSGPDTEVPEAAALMTEAPVKNADTDEPAEMASSASSTVTKAVSDEEPDEDIGINQSIVSFVIPAQLADALMVGIRDEQTGEAVVSARIVGLRFEEEGKVAVFSAVPTEAGDAEGYTAAGTGVDISPAAEKAINPESSGSDAAAGTSGLPRITIKSATVDNRIVGTTTDYGFVAAVPVLTVNSEEINISSSDIAADGTAHLEQTISPYMSDSSVPIRDERGPGAADPKHVRLVRVEFIVTGGDGHDSSAGTVSGSSVSSTATVAANQSETISSVETGTPVFTTKVDENSPVHILSTIQSLESDAAPIAGTTDKLTALFHSFSEHAPVEAVFRIITGASPTEDAFGEPLHFFSSGAQVTDEATGGSAFSVTSGRPVTKDGAVGIESQNISAGTIETIDSDTQSGTVSRMVTVSTPEQSFEPDIASGDIARMTGAIESVEREDVDGGVNSPKTVHSHVVSQTAKLIRVAGGHATVAQDTETERTPGLTRTTAFTGNVSPHDMKASAVPIESAGDGRPLAQDKTVVVPGIAATETVPADDSGKSDSQGRMVRMVTDSDIPDMTAAESAKSRDTAKAEHVVYGKGLSLDVTEPERVETEQAADIKVSDTTTANENKAEKTTSSSRKITAFAEDSKETVTHVSVTPSDDAAAGTKSADNPPTVSAGKVKSDARSRETVPDVPTPVVDVDSAPSEDEASFRESSGLAIDDASDTRNAPLSNRESRVPNPAPDMAFQPQDVDNAVSGRDDAGRHPRQVNRNAFKPAGLSPAANTGETGSDTNTGVTVSTRAEKRSSGSYSAAAVKAANHPRTDASVTSAEVAENGSIPKQTVIADRTADSTDIPQTESRTPDTGSGVNRQVDVMNAAQPGGDRIRLVRLHGNTMGWESDDRSGKNVTDLDTGVRTGENMTDRDTGVRTGETIQKTDHPSVIETDIPKVTNTHITDEAAISMPAVLKRASVGDKTGNKAGDFPVTAPSAMKTAAIDNEGIEWGRTSDAVTAANNNTESADAIRTVTAEDTVVSTNTEIPASGTHQNRRVTENRGAGAPAGDASQESLPDTQQTGHVPVEKLTKSPTAERRAVNRESRENRDVSGFGVKVPTISETGQTAGMVPVSRPEASTAGIKASVPTDSSELTTADLQIRTNTSDSILNIPVSGTEKTGIVQEAKKTSGNVHTGAGTSRYYDIESGVMNTVVRQARILLQSNQASATVVLEPPSLGRMTLDIVTENSKLTGKITVESREVQDIIRSNISDLRQTLAQNGYMVESFDVQVGHNGGTDSWARRENFENLAAMADSGRRAYADESVGTRTHEESTVSTRWPVGMVDIRI